jgi:hypothetical protein
VLLTALCVNTTVLPLSKVTVIEAAVVTASDKVAVILIVAPTLYAPSEVVDEKLLTVGTLVSTTIARVPEIFPAGNVVEVIMFPAKSAGALVRAKVEIPRSELLCPDPIV